MPQRNRTYTKVRETIIANTESVDAPLQARMNNNWNLLVIPFNKKNRSTRNIFDHWNLSTKNIFHHTKADLPDALLAHHWWHWKLKQSNVPSTHPTHKSMNHETENRILTRRSNEFVFCSGTATNQNQSVPMKTVNSSVPECRENKPSHDDAKIQTSGTATFRKKRQAHKSSDLRHSNATKPKSEVKPDETCLRKIRMLKARGNNMQAKRNPEN